LTSILNSKGIFNNEDNLEDMLTSSKENTDDYFSELEDNLKNKHQSTSTLDRNTTSMSTMKQPIRRMGTVRKKMRDPDIPDLHDFVRMTIEHRENRRIEERKMNEERMKKEAIEREKAK
jgi:hypothetical protein